MTIMTKERIVEIMNQLMNASVIEAEEIVRELSKQEAGVILSFCKWISDECQDNLNNILKD